MYTHIMRNCEMCDNKLTPDQKRFCSRPCYGLFLKENPEARNHFKKGAIPWNKGLKGYHAGNKHWHWQGGRRKHPDGYMEIYCPDHPYARHGGYIYEHRYVIEQILGRVLKPSERSHHINGIKDDNRPENLYVFLNNADHSRHHGFKRRKVLVSNLKQKERND